MNISAKELAKLINVSPATVSMVFNNKPGISDATRELVLKTAAEYGYAPKKNESSGASSRIIQLVNYKKHGKVAADTPFFSQLTEGISTECTRQGCALHISYFYETMDIDSQLDALRAVTVKAFCFLQPKWLRPISASSAIFLFRSLSWTAITMSSITTAF